MVILVLVGFKMLVEVRHLALIMCNVPAPFSLTARQKPFLTSTRLNFSTSARLYYPEPDLCSMNASFTVSRQYTLPAFMNTSSCSLDWAWANFKLLRVSLELAISAGGMFTFLVLLPLKLFQKHITLSILPVTSIFLHSITSAQVTSRL